MAPAAATGPRLRQGEKLKQKKGAPTPKLLVRVVRSYGDAQHAGVGSQVWGGGRQHVFNMRRSAGLFFTVYAYTVHAYT